MTTYALAIPTATDEPMFATQTRAAALNTLQRIAQGSADVSRAGVYTRFVPPLTIVYDDPTQVAWLFSISVDGRPATIEATAVWGEP